MRMKHGLLVLVDFLIHYILVGITPEYLLLSKSCITAASGVFCAQPPMCRPWLFSFLHSKQVFSGGGEADRKYLLHGEVWTLPGVLQVASDVACRS